MLSMPGLRMKKPILSLGHRQASIMEVLWLRGPLGPADVHTFLSEVEDVAYTTVHTELNRMVAKGIVRKSKRLQATYEAAITREQFARSSVSSILRGLINAHGAAAIHGFVDIVVQDDEALNVLRRALRERKK
jgi:predicted transcriptional regulator